MLAGLLRRGRQAEDRVPRGRNRRATDGADTPVSLHRRYRRREGAPSLAFPV